MSSFSPVSFSAPGPNICRRDCKSPAPYQSEPFPCPSHIFATNACCPSLRALIAFDDRSRRTPPPLQHCPTIRNRLRIRSPWTTQNRLLRTVMMSINNHLSFRPTSSNRISLPPPNRSRSSNRISITPKRLCVCRKRNLSSISSRRTI